MVKNLPANAGDPGLIPGLARYPRERNGYPLQCSCLENSMDRSVWRATDSSWDHKESDTNEQLIFSHFHFFASLNGSVTLSNCFIFLTQFTLFIKVLSNNFFRERHLCDFHASISQKVLATQTLCLIQDILLNYETNIFINRRLFCFHHEKRKTLRCFILLLDAIF